MLTSLSTEDLIPKDHPIRRIRKVIDEVLVELDGDLDAMYSRIGRPSVPPEQLLKATILMALYSVRSERAFCERLNYDLLFKWFLDLPIDAKAFDATTFTKNRDRLLAAEVADRFFAAVVRQAKLRRYVSSDHFSVDGTLLEAWASHKSFKPKDGPDGPATSAGRNAEVDFHGHKRSNQTHRSTTDPEALLARKSAGTPARLCYAGHLLMENRNALIIDAELTQADGFAERATAIELLADYLAGPGAAPSPPTRATTPAPSSPTAANSASRPMSPRTPMVGAQPSTGAPPATPVTGPVNELDPGSKSPSAGSRPSPADASSATTGANATGPGSSSPPRPTTSCASPPSTPAPHNKACRPEPAHGQPSPPRATPTRTQNAPTPATTPPTPSSAPC